MAAACFDFKWQNKKCQNKAAPGSGHLLKDEPDLPNLSYAAGTACAWANPSNSACDSPGSSTHSVYTPSAVPNGM